MGGLRSNMILIYDGSFEGLMSSIFISFRDKKLCQIESIVGEKYYQPQLFEEEIKKVETDYSWSDRVCKKIEDISSISLKNIIHAYSSELEGIEISILSYIKRVLKENRSIDNDLSDPDISNVVNSCRKVGSEIHKYYGLLRFSKLKDETYYAPIEPVHNIIPLMIPHFKARFADQNWVIHDVVRKSGIIYSKDSKVAKLITISEENKDLLNGRNLDKYYDDDELFFQSLWNDFHKAIAIEERKNLKLQQQFMPKRYWRFLTEK
jgi:probable DNA metabolism protein